MAASTAAICGTSSAFTAISPCLRAGGNGSLTALSSCTAPATDDDSASAHNYHLKEARISTQATDRNDSPSQAHCGPTASPATTCYTANTLTAISSKKHIGRYGGTSEIIQDSARPAATAVGSAAYIKTEGTDTDVSDKYSPHATRKLPTIEVAIQHIIYDAATITAIAGGNGRRRSRQQCHSTPRCYAR